jgi:hypothetical protein
LKQAERKRRVLSGDDRKTKYFERSEQPISFLFFHSFFVSTTGLYLFTSHNIDLIKHSTWFPSFRFVPTGSGIENSCCGERRAILLSTMASDQAKNAGTVAQEHPFPPPMPPYQPYGAYSSPFPVYYDHNHPESNGALHPAPPYIYHYPPPGMMYPYPPPGTLTFVAIFVMGSYVRSNQDFRLTHLLPQLTHNAPSANRSRWRYVSVQSCARLAVLNNIMSVH